MKVRVVSAASNSLQLIDEIPGARKVWLEGQNGIGKSVTVRLLSLVAGQQPYADDRAAWQSLREALGHTRITLSELQSPHETIEVEFTPEHWPDEPLSRIGDALGTFHLDGRPASVEQVQRLVHIAHVHGAERLEGIFGRENRLLAAAVSRVLAVLPRRTDFGLALGTFAQQLTLASPDSAAAATSRRKAAESELNGLLAEEKFEDARRDELNRLTSALSLTADGGDGSALERRESEIASLQAEEDQVQAQIDSLIEKLGDDQPTRERVKDLEKRQKQADARIEKKVAELATIGLDSLSVPDDLESANALLELANSEVDSLTGRLADRSAQFLLGDPRVRATFDDVGDALQLAMDKGLADMRLIQPGESDTALTVASTQSGLAAQRVSFENAERDAPEDAALSRVLASWNQAALILGGLVRDHRASETALRELREIEISDQGSSNALRAELETLRTRSRDLGRRLQSARFALGRVAASIGVVGNVTRESASEVVATTMTALGLTDPSEVAAEHERLEAARHRTRAAIADQRAAVKRATDAEAAVAQTRLALRRAAREGQLPLPLPEPLGDNDLDFEADGGEAFSSFADSVASAASAFNALIDELGAFAGALEDRDIGQGSASPHRSAADRVIRRSVVQQLNAGPIRESLFDGGTVTDVSLAARSISWTVGDRGYELPVSAFSSGNQAFAFTQAQIRAAAEADKPNGLIVLDEFGAFVAADRRDQLASLLDQQLTRNGFSAVVIVPLQANYEDELSETTGALREQFEHRVAEIDSHGYFTEEL